MNRAIDFVRPLTAKPLQAGLAVPASGAPLAQEVDMVFGPLGVQTLRALIVDVEAMACTQRWHITPEGVHCADPAGPSAQAADGFSGAMATIVHLKHDDANATLARRIDPQRWAFAWRVDERHVAVAEACYREVCDDATSGDGALVRQICDAGIHFGRFDGGGAVVRRLSRPLLPAAQAWLVRWPAVTAWLLRRRAIDLGSAGDPSANAARPAGLRWRGTAWLAGAALAAAALAGGLAVLRAPGARSSTEQSLADATMTRLLATTLAGGDYGEVQGVLDSFAQMRYFDGAAVTNGQQRVVAMAGKTPRLRIGDPLPAPAQDSGRLFTLSAPEALSTGQLIVWGAAAAP